MFGCNLSKIDGTEDLIIRDESITLPEEFSYMGNMPKVINQGVDPICVPCSISSFIDWRYSTMNGDTKGAGTDIWGIYDKKSVDGEGMNFKDAFRILESDGVDTKKIGNFKIKNFSKINSFMQLRQSIVVNGPALGVLPVFSNGYFKDEFWKKENGDFQGYHAISIIGYTSDGFIIRNSWGNSYGRKGYGFIKLEDFNKIKELWAIID